MNVLTRHDFSLEEPTGWWALVAFALTFIVLLSRSPPEESG